MTFSLEQALKAQQVLRTAAELPAEQFPLQAFVGMLSDEIEAVRKAGKSDAEIASMINKAAGTQLTTLDIAENYASPESRARG